MDSKTIVSFKRLGFLFIVIILCCCAFQCRKRLSCGTTTYSFSVGIRVLPDRDSLRIGDTIWLEIDEPTTQLDLFTQTRIDYSRAENFGTNFNFAKILGASCRRPFISVNSKVENPVFDRLFSQIFYPLNGSLQCLSYFGSPFVDKAA
jgi:hypothetical protein